MKPNVNYKLWMIMMHQGRFFNCNKCTTLVGGVDNGVGCAGVRAGGIWESSVLSSQFSCEPKTALNKKS